MMTEMSGELATGAREASRGSRTTETVGRSNEGHLQRCEMTESK